MIDPNQAPKSPLKQKEDQRSDPWRYRNSKASLPFEDQEKYRKVVEMAKQAGANVDKILYPSTFGPNGELLGIAVACDIQAGETIMSVPCSYRVDQTTIFAS